MSENNPGSDRVRYEVITQEDENGDLLIPIPEAVLKKLGWKEGQDVEFGVDQDGKIYIKKASK